MRRVMPQVATEDCFALKGGTAINLFMRDMPRLSVYIDLAYSRLRALRVVSGSQSSFWLRIYTCLKVVKDESAKKFRSAQRQVECHLPVSITYRLDPRFRKVLLYEVRIS
ncbi:MAG: nucleotidyl transferase AbiEii/AbiGii toxin family protein [Acidiferrobacterales bacterium]